MSDERRFAEPEVDAILRLAIARQDQGEGLSRAELAEVLSQLGVAPDELDDAIAEHDADLELRAETEGWKAARRRAVISHARVFAGVMSLLMVINLFTTPTALWFVWPLLAWGGALGVQVSTWLRGPDPRELEAHRVLEARRAERLRRRAEKAAVIDRRKARDEAFKRASEELGDVVKAGVTGLIENLGRSIREVVPGASKRAAEPSRVRVSDVRTPTEKVSEAELELELEALRKRSARGER